MKLRINNLCRVADADLDFDGITIIAWKIYTMPPDMFNAFAKARRWK